MISPRATISSASFWNRRQNQLQQWETFLDTDYVGTVTNLFTYSEEFTNADWDKTSFVSLTEVPRPIGDGIAYRIVASNNVAQHQIAQSISFTSGTTYTASIYVKADGIDEIAIALKSNAFSATGKGVFNISTGSLFQETVSDGVISSTYQGNGVYLLSYTRTATATAIESVDFELYGGDSVAGNDVDGLIFWGAQLTESAKPLPYVPTAATSASGTFTAQPRLEYDPATAEPLGYLSEGSSTNFFRRSEEFDDATWNKFQVGAGIEPVVTPNAAIAPDGTKSADMVVFDISSDADGNRSLLRQSITPTQTNTMSFWVRADSATTLQINSSGNTRTNFEVTTEWQRVTYLEDNDFGNAFHGIELRGDRGTGVTNATIYLWGAQLEELPFASSYIRTEAAAVIRSRDAANALISEGSFTNEFSVSYEARHKGYISGDLLRTFVLSDGTSSNRFIAGVAGTANVVRHVLVDNESTQFSDISDVAYDDFRSVQVAAKTNEATVYIDGSQDYQALTVDVPEFNKLDIATNQDANTDFDAFVHIKYISIYDQSLLSSEIPQGASIEGITPVQENKVLPVPQ